MAKVAFTSKLIESPAALEIRCPLPEEGQRTVWDSAAGMPRGTIFGIRSSAGGTRSYILAYRIRGVGKLRRATVGTVGEIRLADAREKALRIAAAAREGKDVVEEQREAREKRERDPNTTVLVERYLEATEKNWSTRHAREQRRALKVYIKPNSISKLKATEVRRDDVRLLIERLAEGPGADTANRVLGLLRCSFEWGVEGEVITKAPAGLKSLWRRIERDTAHRGLFDVTGTRTDPEKIRRVWLGVEACGPIIAGFVRFLLLSGLRLTEASRLRWEYVDLRTGTVALPPEIRKGRRGERRGLVLPLSAQAVNVLESIPHFDSSPWLFPSAVKPSAPMASNWARVIGHARRATGVRFTFHGLRATAATGCAETGAAPHVVSLILGHRLLPGQAPVTANYDRADRSPEIASALNAWAERLADIVAGEKRKAEVVPIRG